MHLPLDSRAVTLYAYNPCRLQDFIPGQEMPASKHPKHAKHSKHAKRARRLKHAIEQANALCEGHDGQVVVNTSDLERVKASLHEYLIID